MSPSTCKDNLYIEMEHNPLSLSEIQEETDSVQHRYTRSSKKCLYGKCMYFVCVSVERRRRDKINNWIVQLSKLVPDCAQEHGKQGQLTGVSAAHEMGSLLG